MPALEHAVRGARGQRVDDRRRPHDPRAHQRRPPRDRLPGHPDVERHPRRRDGHHLAAPGALHAQLAADGRPRHPRRRVDDPDPGGAERLVVGVVERIGRRALVVRQTRPPAAADDPPNRLAAERRRLTPPLAGLIAEASGVIRAIDPVKFNHAGNLRIIVRRL